MQTDVSMHAQDSVPVSEELASTSRGKKRASKQDNSSSKRAKSTLRSRGDDPDVLSVSDFREIFSQCFGGSSIIPKDSPEVSDALQCLSKICQESTADKAVIRDSSRLLPAELIFSLHNVAARASHSSISDYERRIKGMRRKIDRLQLGNAAQAEQLALKDAEITRLKEAHSSCAIDLHKLQKSKEKIANKYETLGQNWEILVQNSENECLRRELSGIKRVCNDHQIDPNQYVFKEIAADKDYLPFYNSEDDEDDSNDEQTESDDNDNQEESEDNDEDAGEDDVEPENSQQEDTDEDGGEDGSDGEETQDKGGEETDLEEDDDVDMNGTK